MNKIFINYNIKIFILLFLIFIISYFILYLFNKYALKEEKNRNEVKEHYLTYFLPFYDPTKTDLANFYKNNDNEKNYLKKKFNY
jgi:hypothetical protein